MQRPEVLKKTWEYKKVYNLGRSYASRHVVLYVHMHNEREERRIGLSISKKVGKAVTRNRIKRVIREIYRLSQDELITGIDLVFIARSRAKDADYKELERSIYTLYKKAGILKKSNGKRGS